MHPAAPFHWQDRDAMRAFVESRAFGALFCATPEGPRVAHVPVVFESADRILFHLARTNALAPHLDGSRGLFVVHGPDGYISPDWYGIDDQVPTWNYIAVELEGTLTRTADDGLPALIDRLSADREERLAPKQPWTRDKMKPGATELMMRGISGWSMDIEHWRGTRKLGQNKPEHVRMAAADGAAGAGQTEIAGEMRHL